MIVPFRAVTEPQRAEVVAGLAAFRGHVLAWPSTLAPAPDVFGPLPQALRAAAASMLEERADPLRDLWIVGIPCKSDTFWTLLHAAVATDHSEAAVDVLLARFPTNASQAVAYDGFGEFVLLALLLERMGIGRLRVPVRLDSKRAGLTYHCWIEEQPGRYIHEGTAPHPPARP